MQEPSALGRIVELVRDLRARCPWDAAQTPETLRPYLVEEALELDHAIGARDDEALRTELGDVLLHVAFQIVLAEERGAFDVETLTRAVEEKMWRRHPHLFPAATSPAPPREMGQEGERAQEGAQGEAQRPLTARQVARDWERHKLAERDDGHSVLDGLPSTLPALIMAYRLQERAAGVGFDWPDADGPRAKVKEELAELEHELARPAGTGRVADELGDLLFAMVNLGRKLGCDPRAALEQANARFAERFRRVEALAAARGIDVGRAGLAELDRLWEEVKRDPQSAVRNPGAPDR